MILLIDNYDSFTYNLYHYFIECGADQIIVKRNDKISIAEIEKLNPKAVILSPGPCTPNESGICLKAIDYFKYKLPILGVCLGHQAIGQSFGAKIIKTIPMHGKISKIYHQDSKIFKNIKSPFNATRYHSLIIDKNTLPQEEFNIVATTKDDIIMAIEHKKYPICGVQFHPESIASEFGHQIIKNFLDIC
jgi:anthranilate synthase/aminodeoxychorismate synthase-like glutamine amidotransferase